MPPDARGDHARFPADGPIEAVLGYALFYVIVARATPTVVDVFAPLLGVRPGLVGLGLAALLWFVLVVAVIDHVRRQLATLGVGEVDASPDVWAALLPPGSVAGRVAVLVVAGLVAAVTYERAVAAAVSFVRVVAALDVAALLSVEYLLLVVFFVAYGLATDALDRLVMGGLRSLRSR